MKLGEEGKIYVSVYAFYKNSKLRDIPCAMLPRDNSSDEHQYKTTALTSVSMHIHWGFSKVRITLNTV